MSNITLTAMNADLQEFQIGIDADAAGIISIENVSQERLVGDALRLLPETNSIVALAMEIFPEILNQTSPERTTGHVSMNDLFTVHLDYINGRLTKAAYDIAKACRSNGMKALPLSAIVGLPCAVNRAWSGGRTGTKGIAGFARLPRAARPGASGCLRRAPR